MNENDIKDGHREQHGTKLDSFTLTSGSAAKGTAVQLKVYFDLQASVEGEPSTVAETKIANARKLWTKVVQDSKA